MVEVLIIDDGSTDGTAEVARAHGADHVVRFTRRKGLAAGFMAGLDACLRLGADVIVNTDADHQYPGHQIPLLVAPILRGEADMVVGDREVQGVAHFSWTKRQLQGVGSWVVRKVSGTTVADATSGFRALNREAALRINIVSEFTYTLESIIQAGKKKMAVAHLPIDQRGHPRVAPVRLHLGVREAQRGHHHPHLRDVRAAQGVRAPGLGAAVRRASRSGARYAYFWAMGDIRGHLQSAILSVLLLILGFQTLQWGIMADLVASNRKLLEDLLYRVRKAELRTARVAEPRAVSVVIPAFNEEDGIADVVARLAASGPWREILVVDDGSTDRTAERAAAAGARVVRHPYNKGNGAAVKTGIREARGRGRPAHGRRRPARSRGGRWRIVAPVGVHDMVIGARRAGDQTLIRAARQPRLHRASPPGSPGRPIPDLTSGFRAARRDRLLDVIHLLPNGFSYPTTSCLAFLKAGLNVAFVPITARPRVGRSKIRVMRDGVRFLLIILKIVTLYSPLKVFFPISAASLLLGDRLRDLERRCATTRSPWGRRSSSSSAVVVFLFGLISEQIASAQDRK